MQAWATRRKLFTYAMARPSGCGNAVANGQGSFPGDIHGAQGLRPENVCCIGDDLPDLPMLRQCGLSVAVADACAEVRNEAHLVTRLAGGCGVVREVVEIILRAQ